MEVEPDTKKPTWLVVLVHSQSLKSGRGNLKTGGPYLYNYGTLEQNIKELFKWIGKETVKSTEVLDIYAFVLL